MEYYSAIEMNKIVPFAKMWMDLETIILSEVSQKNKCIYIEFRKIVMITLYERQQKRHRCIEQPFGLCGRGKGLDDLREWH